MENQAYHEIFQLIADNEIEEALGRMSTLLADDAQQRQLAALSGRWKRVQESQLAHTIGREEADIELNKISMALLDLLQVSVPQPSLSASPAIRQEKARRRWVFLAGVVAIFLGLVGYYFIQSSQRDRSYYFQFAAKGIPAEITHELSDLQARSENVKDISIAPDFSWIILHGRNSTRYKQVPQALVSRLNDFHRTDTEVKQVLLGSHSKWMVLMRYNDFWYSAGFPLEMLAKLDTFYIKGEEIKQLALGAGQDWVILRGQRDFWFFDVPSDLDSALWKVYQQGRDEINGVTLGPNGQWVVLLNKNDCLVSPGLSKSLQKQLAKLKRNDASIRKVVLLDRDAWLVLFKE